METVCTSSRRATGTNHYNSKRLYDSPFSTISTVADTKVAYFKSTIALIILALDLHIASFYCWKRILHQSVITQLTMSLKSIDDL
jgi:hypothetical protein